MENLINCCFLSLVLCVVILAMLAMFFNYSLKLKDKSIELEKKDEEHEGKHNQNCKRIEELEKKNGKELKKIEQLEWEIKELKENLTPKNY